MFSRQSTKETIVTNWSLLGDDRIDHDVSDEPLPQENSARDAYVTRLTGDPEEPSSSSTRQNSKTSSHPEESRSLGQNKGRINWLQSKFRMIFLVYKYPIVCIFSLH